MSPLPLDRATRAAFAWWLTEQRMPKERIEAHRERLAIQFAVTHAGLGGLGLGRPAEPADTLSNPPIVEALMHAITHDGALWSMIRLIQADAPQIPAELLTKRRAALPQPKPETVCPHGVVEEARLLACELAGRKLVVGEPVNPVAVAASALGTDVPGERVRALAQYLVDAYGVMMPSPSPAPAVPPEEPARVRLHVCEIQAPRDYSPPRPPFLDPARRRPRRIGQLAMLLLLGLALLFLVTVVILVGAGLRRLRIF